MCLPSPCRIKYLLISWQAVTKLVARENCAYTRRKELIIWRAVPILVARHEFVCPRRAE